MLQPSIKTNSVKCNLTSEQIIFIKELKLPIVMEITQASEFDTRFVQTKYDRCVVAN